VEWQVRQHADKIKKGDRVYIWSCGKMAGICATGTILEDPTRVALPSNRYYVSRSPNQWHRTVVEINEPLTSTILRQTIAQNAILATLTVIRAPVATNFRVTSKQAVALTELVRGYLSSSPSVHPQTKPIFPLSLSPSESPLLLKSPSLTLTPTQQCYVCHREDGGETMLLCAGCQDWYHPSCVSLPSPVPSSTSPQPSSSSWYCSQCAALNDRICALCQKENPENTAGLLPCDHCERSFHLECLTPPLAHFPKYWLCSTCTPSPSEMLVCQLAIGWRELRAECARISKAECEKASETHRKNILSFSRNRKTLLNKMSLLTAHMRETRQKIVTIATIRYSQWARTLVPTVSPPLSLSSSLS